MLAYLTYMGERLVEMRRLLTKPEGVGRAGSLYLHCDDTASHYLKVLLDAVFGARNYRNHLVWRRANSHNDPQRFGRILDHILYYATGENPYWDGDAIAIPKTDEQLRAAYPSCDERGRYRSADLTGAGSSEGESGQVWRGYDVSGRGRHWAAPKTSAYAAWIEREFIPDYRKIEGVHERLDALDAAGLIHHPKRGVWPGLKRYAAADRDNPPQNLILEPLGFTNYNKGQGEYLGYDTQKPRALVEKLIAVSCPPDGFVLDPFGGCGTTVAAAHALGRRWAGVDISATAIDITQERRLAPLGLQAETFGIPRDLESARKLAADKPSDFEAWAVTRIAGLVPNERKTGDRGIDGRGMLLARPATHDSRLVLAQVKGGAFQIGQLRDFLHVVGREKAACGVFITLDSVSAGARAEARALGEVVVGAERYPRVQLWSIADHFAGRRPHLPALADPETGKPIAPRLL